MKKKLCAALVAMVLVAGFAACQGNGSSKGLIIEGATVTGFTPDVPAKLVIPRGVAVIGEDAFMDCLTLVSVTIPDTVSKIEEYAFSGCESLTSVTIGKSVTVIGENAFEDCTSLKSVTIPDSVLRIEEYAFSGCTSLKEIQYKGTMAQWKALEESGYIPSPFIRCSDGNIEIKDVPAYLEIHGRIVTGCTDEVPANLVIPEGVAIIGFKAFSGCTSLESVTIPDSVTEIGIWAFSDCKSLKSVTIPNSVKEIDSDTFGGCRRGIEVTYKGDLKDWCSSSWDYALVEFNAKSITLSNGTDLKKLTKIDASDLKGITSIGKGAFSWCPSLVNVTIPEGVTKIGGRAFFGCISLENVTIPRGVTEIEYSAFRGCKSLKSVTIPNSVKEIGSNAFSYCSPDLKVQYDGTKAQWGAISKEVSIQKNGDALPIIGTFVVQCTDGVLTEK